MSGHLFTGQTLTVQVDFRDAQGDLMDVTGHTIEVVATLPLDNHIVSEPRSMAIEAALSDLANGVGVYTLDAVSMGDARTWSNISVQGKYVLADVVSYTNIYLQAVGHPLI